METRGRWALRGIIVGIVCESFTMTDDSAEIWSANGSLATCRPGATQSSTSCPSSGPHDVMLLKTDVGRPPAANIAFAAPAVVSRSHRDVLNVADAPSASVLKSCEVQLDSRRSEAPPQATT